MSNKRRSKVCKSNFYTYIYSCRRKNEENPRRAGARIGSIRAGRASAAVLDKISIDYYGAQTPDQSGGVLTSPDPRTLVVQPWDASALSAIVKAIQASDIGINPRTTARSFRLSFPPLTEERRKELSKQVSKYGEEAKVAIRNIRRDAIDKLKDMKKQGEITEDDLKGAEKDMQELTDKYCKIADADVAAKSKEIMEL